MKLIMLKGLPASGKTTYAKKLAESGYVRVNKDDMRSMLHGGKWSKENEKQVLAIRDQIISNSLENGKSVVVDDTNFAPKHAERLKQLAQNHGATFETKFFDVPVEDCIKRDLQRPNSVGEKVIWRMYNESLKPPAEEYIPPSDKPKAIICDIDGTLAHMTGRSPYDYSRISEDLVDETIKSVVNMYYEQAIKVLIVSGRKKECLKATHKWLEDNQVNYDELFIDREAEDNRKDTILKREMFDAHIRNHYHVLFVLDDRNQVVDMWRNELGLKVLQVAEGDF